MKSLSFIYTRRMLIILGLFVVAISLAVVYWVNSADNKKAENADDGEESAELVEAEPAPTTEPADISNDGQTTWNQPEKAPEYEPGSPEERATAVLNEVGVALQNEDSQKLYDLLSAEIKGSFTVESVEQAMGATNGLSLTPEGAINMRDDFAEQKVVGKDSQGNEQSFLVVLRNEDGAWKLYGTVEL